MLSMCIQFTHLMSRRESFSINNFLFKTFLAIGDIKVVNKWYAKEFKKSRISSFYFLYYLLFFVLPFMSLFEFSFVPFDMRENDQQKKNVIEFVFEWKFTHYKILGRIGARVSYYCNENKLFFPSGIYGELFNALELQN